MRPIILEAKRGALALAAGALFSLVGGCSGPGVREVPLAWTDSRSAKAEMLDFGVDQPGAAVMGMHDARFDPPSVAASQEPGFSSPPGLARQEPGFGSPPGLARQGNGTGSAARQPSAAPPLRVAAISPTALGPVRSFAAADPFERGGARTLAPLAFVRFCQRYAGECDPRSRGPDEVPAWSPDLQDRLERVNASVNAEILPAVKGPDEALSWTIGPARGDCNDYAVTKRHRLLGMGLPSSALILAAVETPRGEPHLVLLVRTDRGTLVLDNLERSVRPWSGTSYRLIARQTRGNPRSWVS